MSNLGETPELVAWSAVLLGCVFGWSAAAKALRLRDVAMTLVAFGVLARPRLRLAVALVMTEGLLAVALFSSALYASDLSRPALAAASALLLLFAAAIARSLRKGAVFPCLCFGSDEVISASTLLRALLLAAFSAAAAAGPQVASFGPRQGVEALISCISVLAVLVLIQSARGVLRRIDPFWFEDAQGLVVEEVAL